MRPSSSGSDDLVCIDEEFNTYQLAGEFQITNQKEKCEMDQYIVSSDDEGEDNYLTLSNSFSSMSSMASMTPQEYIEKGKTLFSSISEPISPVSNQSSPSTSHDYLSNYTFLPGNSALNPHFKNRVPRESPFTFTSTHTSLNPLLIIFDKTSEKTPQVSLQNLSRRSSLEVDQFQILPDENDLFQIAYTSEPEDDYTDLFPLNQFGGCLKSPCSQEWQRRSLEYKEKSKPPAGTQELPAFQQFGLRSPFQVQYSDSKLAPSNQYSESDEVGKFSFFPGLSNPKTPKCSVSSPNPAKKEIVSNHVVDEKSISSSIQVFSPTRPSVVFSSTRPSAASTPTRPSAAFPTTRPSIAFPTTPPQTIDSNTKSPLVRYQRTIFPKSPGTYFLVQFHFHKRLQLLQKVSTPFQFGVRTPDSLRLPPVFTEEFYSLRETRYYSLETCKALGQYELPEGMTNNFPNRLGIISPYLDAQCTETSIVSSQQSKKQLDNDRYFSRLNIYELSKLLNLDKWSIELTREIEGNILELFSFYCGFELGYKTWIRDTKKSTRTVLLERLHRLTLVFYPEICMQTLGVIIRRGTYSIMQSRLRKERRSKRANK